jgi:hypothetical protein
MRIEHEYSRPEAGPTAAFDSCPQQAAMRAVNAVEVTDGQRARLEPNGLS